MCFERDSDASRSVMGFVYRITKLLTEEHSCYPCQLRRIIMNNVELSAKVKSCLKGSSVKAKKFEDLVAVSISLISENPEDMYVAVREGEILVDHYSYDDNNCAIEASAETIEKLFCGEMSFESALAEGYVKVSGGDVAKFKALEVLVPAKKAKDERPAKPASAVKEEKSEKTVSAAKAEEKPAKTVSAKPAAKSQKNKKK